jgi:putative transposase
MAALRKSYHTEIFFLYRLGVLPSDILTDIPYSTRYNWRKHRNTSFFAISTFYLYLRKMELSAHHHSYKTDKEGIHAQRPGEIIHADITEFRLSDNRKVYIYHFADNFSRYPFRAFAAFERKPEITLRNLESIISDFPHFFKERATLLVDDGVENKGALVEFAKSNTNLVRLLIAMKDIMFSNSLIEARNKSLKNEYLKDKPFYSIDSLQNFLDTEYLDNFRNRPLAALTGFTPKEVLNGSIPFKHRFTEQMALAKSDRITTNQTFDCKTCSADSLKD